MKRTNKFPEKILVSWEGEPEESYLAAHETNCGLEDGTDVGVYQLVVVKRQMVTEELVPYTEKRTRKRPVSRSRAERNNMRLPIALLPTRDHDR